MPSVVAWDLVPLVDRQQAHRHQRAPSSVPSPADSRVSAIIALHRTAGNRAVTELLTGRPRANVLMPSMAAMIGVQRCGPVGCDCGSSEETAPGLLNVQRTPQPEGKSEPKDVVLILSPATEREDARTQAAVIAPGAQLVFATSPQEMVDGLKARKTSVRTLFFIGHSNADGDIVFETPGKQEFVRAETIAQKVKGIVQVENIDFQGCAVGVSPAEMGKVRTALKATKARGSTCELVRQVAGPIEAPGKKAITDRSAFDLDKPENRKLFDAGLKKLRDAFGDDRKKCIINNSEDGYFQAHGKLVAIWANPESIAGNDAFDKGKSVCYSQLKVEKVDPSKNPVIDENQCKIVELM